jgi:hypothetical protein
LYIPLADRHDQEKLGPIWQVRDVRHPVRGVSIEPLQFILMRTDDHQVRADMKFVVRRSAACCLYPRAYIHVGDSEAIDLRLSGGKAILDPAKEGAIEAVGLVVRIAGDGRKARPFAGAFAKHAVLAAGGGWPVEQCRILGDKRRTGAQCIRDLFGVGRGP